MQGWNDHDGAAVVRLFAPEGTYVDPTLPGPLPGEAIATHLAGVVAAFPDLAFAVEGFNVDGDRNGLGCLTTSGGARGSITPQS